MPSVALDCRIRSTTDKDRLNLEELVLDGVAADERIEAAYAIVELGERKAKKVGVGLPLSSSAEDEDLDIDETELYHQVPRSPDCLRECGRGACAPGADASPSRDAPGNLLRKIGHVQGAVMPTRTLGNPVQKLTAKRRCEDDTIRGEVKAKLARMLIERKSSQEEAGRSGPGNGMCRKYSENDSDDEQVTESGRFVRTSMPVLQSLSIASSIKSVTNYKNLFETFQANPEQFTSAEELHNSLRESVINEQVVLLEGIDNQYHILPQEISSQRRLEEVANHKLNDASKNRKICSSGISSKNSASYSSSCLPDSLFLESEGDLHQSECMSASNKDMDNIDSEIEKQSVRDRRCLLIRPTDRPTSASGTAGLLQYYMLPVIKTLPDSVNYDFPGVQPAVGGSIESLKQLEDFGRGKDHYSEPVPKVVQHVPETLQWNAGRKFQLSGSSDGIFGYYDASGGALSEAGPPLSGLIESLSLQNLSHIPRDSPKMANSDTRLKSQKRDVLVNKYKKSQSVENKLTHRATPNVVTKMSNARRRISGIADALEMVRGGEFGSLRTLRNLYTRMKTRDTADSSAYLLKGSKLQTRTECRLLGSEEQEQELPLDLSWRHRRTSCQPPEVKFEAEPCHLYHLQSCETFSSPDGCKQKACSLSSKAAIENSTSRSDKLQMKADVTMGSGSDCSKNNKDGDKQYDGLSPHSVPNSHLPPKKRKFIRLMSQNCDFPETKAPLSTKSTFPFQVLPDESSAYHISTKSCSGQALHGRTFFEAGAKVLTGVIANDESILSAVAVRDEDGDLPLHIAVAQGCEDVVRKLLHAMSTAGTSVDSCNNNRQTALHLAVLSNQTRMVELLLSESASANVRDRKGNTAVHLAVKYKMLSCLRKILENSRTYLDLDARNYEGLTALHIGVQLSQAEAVRILLKGGANPNATDGTNGRTPLFNAVEANDLVITSTLIQHGSDPFVASYSGCTPLQIAAGKSLGELVSIMETSGRECSRFQDSN